MTINGSRGRSVGLQRTKLVVLSRVRASVGGRRMPAARGATPGRAAIVVSDMGGSFLRDGRRDPALRRPPRPPDSAGTTKAGPILQREAGAAAVAAHGLC